MTLLILQHVIEPPALSLGTFLPLLEQRTGLSWQLVPPGRALPLDLQDVSGILLLGGPMSAYEQERYPFLREEARLIEKALREDVPILGICLGAQVLARVLGATVQKAERPEIGWLPASFSSHASTDPLWQGCFSPQPVFLWHGDTLPLPPGATRLASSRMSPTLGFRYASAYGWLMHLEITSAMIEHWCLHATAQLKEAEIDRATLLGQEKTHRKINEALGTSVMASWLDQVQARQQSVQPAPFQFSGELFVA